MIKTIRILELTDCLEGMSPAPTTFRVPGYNDAAMTLTTDCDEINFTRSEMYAIYKLLHEGCA